MRARGDARAAAAGLIVLLAGCGPDASTVRACEALRDDPTRGMALAAIADDDVLREHARDYLAVHGLGFEEGQRRSQAAAAVVARCIDLGILKRR